MPDLQQGETPQPPPEPQQPVRDIMQVAVTDPKRRFVFNHEVNDTDYLPLLPYNKAHLIFNPGHSHALYNDIAG